MALIGLVRANNLSDVTSKGKAWDNLGNDLTTGEIAIPAPSFSVNFANNQSFIDEVSGNNLFIFSRASTGTFLGSNGLIQTAASGVPRFDYNPATGESLGLLAEEARTNLLTYSQSIGTGFNTINLNSTLTQNAAVAPDGTPTATTWIENSGTSTHDLFVGTATGRHAYSIFAKEIAGSAKRYIALSLVYGGDVQGRIFDLSENGLVSPQILGSRTQHLAGTTGSIQKLANGWYRCTVYWSGTDTSLNAVRLQIVNNFTGNSFGPEGLVSYTGDGTSGLLVWGVQLEAGAFSTSYIPTSGTTVVRAVDLLTISGANLFSFYNASTGTIYTEQLRQGSSAGVVIGDSAGNRLLDWQPSYIYSTSWEGANYSWTGVPAVSVASLNRAALTYGSSLQGAVNGTSYALSPFVPSGSFATTSLRFQGVFSRIIFWQNQLTPRAAALITAISNTEIGYLPSSYSTNFVITGGDILALKDVYNVSTRNFAFIKGLSSAVQPRLATAFVNTASGVTMASTKLLKLSPSSIGNYFVSSGSLSAQNLKINGIQAASLSSVPFSGTTALFPLNITSVEMSSNFRLAPSFSAGVVSSPSIGVLMETSEFLLYGKVGQN